MNERIIEITDLNVHLSVDRGFLKASIQNGDEYKIPFSDIGSLIANSYGLTYSNNLLVKLAELNIPLIICNQKHAPVAILYPVETHSLMGSRIDSQINAPKKFYGSIWQDIIKIKIFNQFICLKALGKETKKFAEYINKVKYNDSGNTEAQAAKSYWDLLFGANFTRNRNESGINSMLNYGYTILRSGISRAIMATGLHPAIGIFHKNKYNPMRLSDDLMEPFRPIVDYLVYNISMENTEEITPEIKKKLANVLYMDMNGPRGRSPVINRMQSMAQSYAYSLQILKKNIDMPILKVEDLLK